MRRAAFPSLVIATLMAASAALAAGPDSAPSATRDAPKRLVDLPRLLTPDSSLARPGEAGRRAHTNVLALNAEVAPRRVHAAAASGFGYETPASLACLYRLVAVVPGCNPGIVSAVARGGSRVIVIVDAYDDPTALVDLQAFSQQFGLPVPTASSFQLVYAQGSEPARDPTGGWELEESLDIEMAHAMAPKAKIILVEAADPSTANLYPAVQMAAALAAQAGGGEVSMSWGTGEYAGESNDDGIFTGTNVVFVASTGDSPGTSYPSVSPNVVAAGGTSIGRNPVTGNFEYEASWDQAGGGASAFEPLPAYQGALAALVGGSRAVPDLAAVANPETGVYIYDSNALNGTTGPWWVAGGTSAAAPLLAGMANEGAKFASSTQAELTAVYANLGVHSIFNDITLGTCGPYEGYPTARGWDACTGVGSPHGRSGL